ncbi:MAG: hypothetical protein HWN68_04540 [Desulfobacterales bacterium]|nr:hypothetical protein [Desulfobacterales bacterium]
MLVYCVCSLEPEEGEDAVQGFLESRGDFVVDRTPTRLTEADEVLVDSSGFFTTLPQEHDMDGFFGGRFKRVAL